MTHHQIEADPLQRVRLDLCYDGTDFSGWARQPGRRTAQGVLEDALGTVLREPVRLTVAGRTDAGVHALGQVAHLDLPGTAWAEQQPLLLRRLAGILPPDLRVRAVSPVPADFDARFAALWRRYEFRICDAPSGPSPLRRRFVLGWPRPLSVEDMASAAEGLVGLQDFAAFCRRREGATTVRALESFTVTRAEDEIVCALRADAFCHSMVRSLVGALLAVGEGRRSASWPAQLLGSDRRADDVTVAPPHGLTLMEVGYPPESELAARAALTRTKRDAPAGRRPSPGVESGSAEDGTEQA